MGDSTKTIKVGKEEAISEDEVMEEEVMIGKDEKVEERMDERIEEEPGIVDSDNCFPGSESAMQGSSPGRNLSFDSGRCSRSERSDELPSNAPIIEGMRRRNKKRKNTKWNQEKEHNHPKSLDPRSSHLSNDTSLNQKNAAKKINRIHRNNSTEPVFLQNVKDYWTGMEHEMPEMTDDELNRAVTEALLQLAELKVVEDKKIKMKESLQDMRKKELDKVKRLHGKLSPHMQSVLTIEEDNAYVNDGELNKKKSETMAPLFGSTPQRTKTPMNETSSKPLLSSPPIPPLLSKVIVPPPTFMNLPPMNMGQIDFSRPPPIALPLAMPMRPQPQPIATSLQNITLSYPSFMPILPRTSSSATNLATGPSINFVGLGRFGVNIPPGVQRSFPIPDKENKCKPPGTSRH